MPSLRLALGATLLLIATRVDVAGASPSGAAVATAVAADDGADAASERAGVEAGQLDAWDATPETCAYDARLSSGANLAAILACERPERFGRDAAGRTYCNAYAQRVLDVVFPLDVAALGLTPDRPSILADGLYAYLWTHWRAVPLRLSPDARIVAAQRLADAGYAVVASEPGHVGFVEASSLPPALVTRRTMLLAQGGATAGRDVPLDAAWRGAAIDGAVVFFYKYPGAPVELVRNEPFAASALAARPVDDAARAGDATSDLR